MSKYSLTELQTDVLQEITNIGGGNAATGISEFIGKPVDMDVPVINILKYEQVFKQIMPEDEIVNAVLVPVKGSGEGIFLYAIEDEMMDKFIDMLMPDADFVAENIKQEKIVELVDILVDSFINGVSKLLDVELTSEKPGLVVDMFGAILSSVYMETGQYDDDIMLIKNEFSYLGDMVISSLYFIPKPGVLDKLFKSIGL